MRYLFDGDVGPVEDAEIRRLLSRCFTEPQDAVFHDRRYYNEPYPHRWIVRDEDDRLIAHAGVHEKIVRCGGNVYGAGGIAEVCVDPDFRGRGITRDLLSAIHEWLSGSGFFFSVLMGDPQVYQSSGYRSVGNLYCDDLSGRTRFHCAWAMVRPLRAMPWPDNTEVYIPGPVF